MLQAGRDGRSIGGLGYPGATGSASRCGTTRVKSSHPAHRDPGQTSVEQGAPREMAEGARPTDHEPSFARTPSNLTRLSRERQRSPSRPSSPGNQLDLPGIPADRSQRSRSASSRNTVPARCRYCFVVAMLAWPARVMSAIGLSPAAAPFVGDACRRFFKRIPAPVPRSTFSLPLGRTFYPVFYPSERT
jgi:hypothetical protein